MTAPPPVDYRILPRHVIVVLDALAWFEAVGIAALMRYDFDPRVVDWSAILSAALVLAAVMVAVGFLARLYRGGYLTGSFDELIAVAAVAAIVSALGTVAVVALRPDGIPRSIPLAAGVFALIGMLAWRYLWRVRWQRRARPQESVERVIVLGAGEVGSTLVQRMLRESGSTLYPVAFLDDDPAKRNFQIHGVRVRGDRHALGSVASAVGANTVIVAINNADAALFRSVSDEADRVGLRCMVMPSLSSMFGRTIQLGSVRDIEVHDVIGRRPVETDIREIAHYVSGKRVLVTGAGGSIGSELCRQLRRFGPAELVMLDRDESALHAVQLSIDGHGLLDSSATALVDIRDLDALRRIYDEHRPEVVFHAAALKHLPLLERYPLEAWKSNVHGTLNVLRASSESGVERFVNISTDKAADPTSVLGHSKRLAEQLTAWFDQQAAGTYLSVRFGNVLGSRGSVLHAFSAQIQAGGPVTVTDPDVTRFFMTIPEACELVVQAGAIGRGGEALVLDMGEPVRIVDVARRMIQMSGTDVDIVFTGLRPGEKMHEVLFSGQEADSRPFHPLISHVGVVPVAPDDLEAQPWSRVVLGSAQELATVDAR